MVTLQRSNRNWLRRALQILDADQMRSGETNLLRLDMPALPGIAVYFKDESTHPTGSLKHRLARSLFTYGLCNGWIGPGTTVIESSSGSTAVSEAYFAHLLGLKFIAVMPAHHLARKGRSDPSLWRRLPFRRRPDHRLRGQRHARP